MLARFLARRAWLACVLILTGPDAGVAQPLPPALRLDTLLAEVAAQNPTLLAARLEAAARAEVGEQAAALPDPTVSVAVLPFPLRTARAEQMVPWPGTRALRRAAADASARSAAYEAEVLALDLAYEAREAYYDAYVAQALDSLLAAFAARLEAFAEAAATRYEVGRGPQGAILQVQLEAQRVATQRLGLQARIASAAYRLARLRGRPDRDAERVERPAVPVLDTLLAGADAHRPERAVLEAARQQADADAALARKAFYPDVGVGVTLTLAPRGMPAGADEPGALGLMVSARLPLQRGRLHARVAETRYRARQVAARRDALEDAIATQVADAAFTARQESEALARYHDRLLPQAQATVESLLAAYTTGQVDYTAFLDAERSRFDVQVAHLETLRRYLQATARLARTLGLPLSSPARP